MIYTATVASMKALTGLTAGTDVIATTEFYTGIGTSGGGVYDVVLTSGVTPNGYNIIQGTTDTTVSFVLRTNAQANVMQFGAKGDGTQDEVAFIQAANDYIGAQGGGKVLFPDPTGYYRITSIIYFNYDYVRWEGQGSTLIQYENESGGTAIKAAASNNVTINECGFVGLKLYGDTSNGFDVGIDISGFAYSTFDNINIQTKVSGGVNILGQGHNGSAPYYNTFNNFILGGNNDQDVTGILLTGGSFDPTGQNGANGNNFSNCRRAFGLNYFADIQRGNGNNFVNIQAESISEAYFRLNFLSAANAGSGTSATINTFTDTSANFYTDGRLNNGAIEITGGTGVGQIRRIASHTATVITTTTYWTVIPDSTSTYLTFPAKAVGNHFANIRGEGDSTASPYVFEVLPGTYGNKVTNIGVDSVGDYLYDKQAEPSNRYIDGDRVILSFFKAGVAASQTGLKLNPPLGATIDAGGSAIAPSFVVESMTVSCQGVTAGSATVKLDIGYDPVISSSTILTAYLNTTIDKQAIVFQQNYREFNGQQKPLSVIIDTDASWAAGSNDVNVNVVLRAL